MRSFSFWHSSSYSGASAREARQRSTMGKKNWSPIKPRKFGYDVSVRPSVVRTDSGGWGGTSQDIPHGHSYGKLKNAIFPCRFFVYKSQKNTHFYLLCQQTIGEVDLTFQGRVSLKQNVKENGREQGLTDKHVARKFAKEQATAGKKAR